ncbi:hypothetical protein, partial [Limosilactobacillus fermentum]|uniref:hypothetical protein n=1 Tax=Limosilactobacillus fermentum TaxID=1613 RepID=UPI003BB1167E
NTVRIHSHCGFKSPKQLEDEYQTQIQNLVVHRTKKSLFKLSILLTGDQLPLVARRSDHSGISGLHGHDDGFLD